ncbi:MAG: methyl-accepting chemotaxis protein, partial [Noviherbaspirillum sp.]
ARLVDQAGATMQEIVESVKRVTDIMGEITAASQEQTSGIEQINQAISQMDEGTQQNAALVEEAAAAADAMQNQAANLAQLVSVFKLNGMTHTAVAAPIVPMPARPIIAAPNRSLNVPQKQPRITASGSPKSRGGVKPVAGGEWEEF